MLEERSSLVLYERPVGSNVLGLRRGLDLYEKSLKRAVSGCHSESSVGKSAIDDEIEGK